MDSIFAQLQALSTLNKGYSISSTRKQLNEIVKIFQSREEHVQEVTWMAELGRNLKPETLLKCDSFMVQPDTSILLLPEELRHESLGFCRESHYVFEGRYVFPVKDVKGDVMGFCGYDKFSEMKYMDSRNFGYVAKRYSVWGMEMMEAYYKSKDPVFFVEGIVCALYLRQEGLQALAMLGSSISPYVTEIAKRFKERAIFISDSDEAGTKFRRALRYKIPYAQCIQSNIAKDVDDSREVSPEFVQELRKMSNPFYRSHLFK